MHVTAEVGGRGSANTWSVFRMVSRMACVSLCGCCTYFSGNDTHPFSHPAPSYHPCPTLQDGASAHSSLHGLSPPPGAQLPNALFSSPSTFKFPMFSGVSLRPKLIFNSMSLRWDDRWPPSFSERCFILAESVNPVHSPLRGS